MNTAAFMEQTPAYREAFKEVRLRSDAYSGRKKKRKDTVRKKGEKYELVSGRGKVLGEHGSEEQAMSQERAIQASKRRRRRKKGDRFIGLKDLEAKSNCQGSHNKGKCGCQSKIDGEGKECGCSHG